MNAQTRSSECQHGGSAQNISLFSTCCFLAPNGRKASIGSFVEAVRTHFVERGNIFENINVIFRKDPNKFFRA